MTDNLFKKISTNEDVLLSEPLPSDPKASTDTDRNGKWKTVRTKVAQFCGVYDNVTRMTRSGAGDIDYRQLALTEYQAEYGILFTLIHCWKKLSYCQKFMRVKLPKFEANKAEKNKRYKSSGNSSSFNTQSEHGSYDMNTKAGGDEEEDVQDVQRPMEGNGKEESVDVSGNEDTLARLMIN
nr:hypothetical protein [Tanacetum cinerariifolium]